MTECTVVVLNWNGWRDTLGCLDSLLASNPRPRRVIVCDNASRDDSCERIAQWGRDRLGAEGFARLSAAEAARAEACSAALGARVVLLENGANLGFAGGNNPGIRLALRDPACSHVWVLNNDTVVRPDALGQALARMRADPRIGLCGSTLIYHDEPHLVQAYGGASYSRWTGRSRHLGAFAAVEALPADGIEVEGSMAYVVGAAMLASRTFIETVGLMREDYFLYCEELDWATRGRERFRLGYAPASIVLHKEGASIGTTAQGGSPLSVYYLFRNRLRYTWRYYPVCLLSVIGFTLIDVARLARRRRWPQVAAALRGLLQWPQPGLPR